ncbi:hypothetical protein Fmac_002340 [Flemingia macrophylla]|uniref:Uncharacterized protein n=1 Tax=Flemingia macrophylla TaxID=520843 RepID=A0ABD1NJN0_9FABA
MATNTPPEKNLEHLKQEEEDEEQEEEEEASEALSLCDLPLDYEDQSKAKPSDSRVIETQDDFDFCLWGGPFSTESEMCAADEVFFQGQILPLPFQQLKRCESMSEFRSNSSRSSSIGSQNSSSSSYSYSTATASPTISKPRVQNQNHSQSQNHFHAHPSPQPQLKATIPRQTSFVNHGRKSSAWEFFRLGVAPAPEIALQDLKVRGAISVNKNFIGRNSNSNSNLNASTASSSPVKTSYSCKKNHVLERIVGRGGGFWSGCKCSVETVQSDVVMIKSGTKSSNKTESTALTHAMKEKVVERKKQKHRKSTMSRRRTFEWLKELSHGSYPDDEALLSKSWLL